MRVLYLLSNYPQSSESYIDAEIRFVRSKGVEVAVWSPMTGYGEMPKGIPVFYGDSPYDAIGDFRPDLLHIHYLVTAKQILRNLSVDLPITIRAHSFDWDLGRAADLCGIKNVLAIYAFPHFAREAGAHSKVVPMSVAFDAEPYDIPISDPIAPGRVIRLAAGRRMKGLEDFFAVSWKLFPGAFQMAVSTVKGDEEYIDRLIGAGMKTGVTVFRDLGRAKAVQMTRTAGIYLDTSDPTGHPFGMPISVAEALASGLVVIMRDSPAAREYGGEAAVYYKTADEAAILVKHALNMSGEARVAASALSIERSRLFRSDVVLPRLVDDWYRFVPENFS